MDEPTARDGEAVDGAERTATGGDDTGDASGGGHLQQAAADPGALAVVPASHYQLGTEHARGGLGRVLRGRDRRLDRPVAIKELLRESPVNRARFYREARITARLQHPGIVPIYEAGVWPGGQPFYAMRMVEGRTLSEAIAGCSTLADRLGLLSRVLVVAETMAYAHSQDVIHRDLKPSNVLVGDYGETVVIDWGIAKQIGEADDVDAASDAVISTDLTVAGQVLGTPWYMAPEQARGEDTGKPADVYALGAIIYHLLAGQPPHGETPGVVQAVAAGVAPPPLASRVAGVPADLVTLVDKALRADPDDRYPSAAELAADLRRFLSGQLVSVHHYGLGALIARWIGRHRAAVAIGALALVALVVGGAISIANIVSARDDARQKGALATTRADQIATQRDDLILTQAESALDRDPTAALTWLKTYPASGSQWNRVRTIAADAQSRGVARHVLGHGEEVHVAALSADGSVLATGSEEHIRIWDLATGTQRAVHAMQTVNAIAISADGQRVAATSEFDHDVRLWTWASGEPRRLSGHAGVITKLELTADGDLVSSGEDGTIRTWDETGAPRLVLAARSDPFPLDAVMDDGARLATIKADGRVQVVDLATGAARVLGTVTGAPRAIAVSPGSALVVAASDDGLWLWPAAGGAVRRLGQGIAADALLFGGTDTLVALVLSDQSLRVVRLTDGHETRLAHDRPISSLSASGQGWVASGDVDGTVRLWRPGPGSDDYTATVLSGHRRAIRDLQFARDGQRLVSVSGDYDARVWDLAPAAASSLRLDRADIFQLAYIDDGAAIVATAKSGAVYRVDVATGQIRTVGRHATTAYALATSADGTQAVTAAWDGTIQRWDLARGTATTVRAGGGDLHAVAMSPDGSHVATAGDDGAELGAAGAALAPLAGHDGAAWAVAFSPDGTLVATGGADATVRLWDVASGRQQHVLRGHRGTPTRPTFTADGGTLVTGGLDGDVRAWSTATGAGILLGRHAGAVRAIAISSDGRRVYSGGRDGTIRIWDRVTGAHEVLGNHASEVRDLAIAPDGLHVASASLDGSVRLWDLAARSSQPVRGGAGFQRLKFRADGRQLAATCADGTLLLVPIPLPGTVPVEPGAIRAWLEATTTAGRSG